MTENNPMVIEGEVVEEATTTTVVVEEESSPATPTRSFRMVTHKSPCVRSFAPFEAEQDMGGDIDPSLAPQTIWWCSQDWAGQVVSAGAELPQLLGPNPGFVAGLDKMKWLHRDLVMIRKKDVPNLYEKNPQLLEDHPQVVISTGSTHSELIPPLVCEAADLARGIFPAPYSGFDDDVMVQLEEPFSSLVEVRYWIANGELTAASTLMMGILSWESPLFLEMQLNPQAQELVRLADAVARSFAAEVDGPPGYAVDFGVSPEGVVTVLRVWPSWSADVLSGNPVGIFRSIVAAHDFDQVDDRWRWKPDLRIYDRAQILAAAIQGDDPAPTTSVPDPVPAMSESEILDDIFDSISE